MPLKGYKDLIVWQKSMDLIVEVYRLVKLLPKSETYALSDQMRRAVISIASNIAEGKGRDSTREYARFLNISRGSCFELETPLNACVLVEYLTEDENKKAFDILEEIGKMLSTMLNKLNLKIRNSNP
ncbi:MAG: four helix bundle protein [Selenomonadaceae bacterium]|nr:four helix bundle protein [Selenomonadaceae bacterium]